MQTRSLFFLAGALMTLTGCGAAPGSSQAEDSQVASTGQPALAAERVINHSVLSLQGETVDLSDFRGRPILIVNTASKCGYTPQYDGLQKLHETYGESGLVVIGFPSNDFGNQEPGTAEEIGNFCRLNYGVTFPMMAKIHTKGPDQAPLYQTLTTQSAAEFRGEVPWNFTKFLVDGDGQVVGRFDSKVKPLDPQITSAVEALLADGALNPPRG
ncbi:MAG: glutathione peroxidase [Acidobacteriota bacterium]|nr:glutathione peroxidase [Acidobacteriota bacterium]